MGTTILIYDGGQRYKIDSDCIYIPKFDTKKKEDKDKWAKEVTSQELKKTGT